VSGREVGRPIALRRLIGFLSAIVVAFFLCALAFQVITTPVWSAEAVFRAWTESQHDLVLDSHGEPKIACLGLNGGYYSLNFVEKVDGRWNTTYLKFVNRDYRGASIALDSMDRVYICTGGPKGEYTDASYLTYATNRDGSWSVEDIDLGYEYYSSWVGVDSENGVHILCSGLDHMMWGAGDSQHSYVAHLLHFYDGANGWERSEVFPPVENATTWVEAFKIGPGDVMHALVSNVVHPWGIYDHYGTVYLNYSSTSTGAWTQETVTPGFETVGTSYWLTGRRSMAVDAGNKAHICGYTWNNHTSCYTIAYANNVDGEWSVTNLSYGGNMWPTWNSIALDGQGAVHIVYYADYYTESPHFFNQTERYVTNRDGSWKQEILDDKKGWQYSQRICVAVGSDDKVHVAYLCNLGGEDTGDRYTLLYVAPTDRSEALTEAVVVASLYALGAALLACVCVAFYVLLERRRLNADKRAEKRERRYRGLFPPDE